MSLFKFPWLRRLVRRAIPPIPVDRAAYWKQRLSIVYMLIAWNAFGFVGYMIYNGKADWAKFYGLKSEEESKISPGRQWASLLGLKKGTLYKISGLNVTKEEIDNTTDEKGQTANINT